MANSALATYRKHSANNSGARQGRITKITPHHMCAVWTAANCAEYFYHLGTTGERQASSNYCVGYDGSIAVSVDEDKHSWASSNWANDDCAVTIEVADKYPNGGNGGEITPAAYEALVRLSADICNRNGITPRYTGTPSGTITLHCMYASTDCPGAYLKKKITSGQFEKDVKAQMKKGTPASSGTASDAAGANTSLLPCDGFARVTYSGKEGLAFHSKPDWTDKTIAGTAKKGDVFTIVGKQKVDGAWLYKTKSGFYITASSVYVEKIQELPKKAGKKSVDALAKEVIAGKWGNGAERKKKLKAAGYDPDAVQKAVNRLLG